MPPLMYYLICGVLSLSILIGIFLMSKVKTAATGNLLSGSATALAIVVTLVHFKIFSELVIVYVILGCMLLGAIIGLYLAQKVKMIQMPELVALLNGVGGAASALVGGAAIFTSNTTFEFSTAILALIIGTLTFTGSIVAAGKLSNRIQGKPIIWKGHQLFITVPTILLLVLVAYALLSDSPTAVIVVIVTLLSAFLGIAITIRVGGADMPITISLLNSFSGVAGAIAGMAIGDLLLVSVGGIVGASGLLLTQIMCGAMNSSLTKILLGKTSTTSSKKNQLAIESNRNAKKVYQTQNVEQEKSAGKELSRAKNVIIVPGYGMALAQAQHLVKQLADTLEKNGAEVKYAIHAVAGRMPGHMNVLLCEADVGYEQLYEMDDVNDEFSVCDVCIVVGANDVLNPAAREAEGTPIYGMPILNVDQAKHIVICNYDLRPGYAGVENPLYTRTKGVSLLLGDARETLQNLLKELKTELEVELLSEIKGSERK